MNRWAVWMLVVAVLGAGGYVAWDRLRQGGSADDYQVGSAPLMYVPSEDPVEALIEDVTNEFFQHQAIKPSPVARQRVQQLAQRGPKAKEAAVIFKDWLRQMFAANEAASEEFREMAKALAAVEPDEPRQVIKRHFHAQDDEERKFAEMELTAFGRPAQEAALHGLRAEPAELREAAQRLLEKINSSGKDSP